MNSDGVRISRANHVTRLGWLMAGVLSVGPTAFSADAQPKFRGIWKPIAGAGAIYRIEERGEQPDRLDVAVVGQENGAYWIETRANTTDGYTIRKCLVAPNGMKRFIVKYGQQQTIELLPRSVHNPLPATDVQTVGRLVGQEPITTRAGTFACDHYRINEGREVIEAWVSKDVSPYGLVKWQTTTTSITIDGLLTSQISEINETPTPPDVPMMPKDMDLKAHSH